MQDRMLGRTIDRLRLGSMDAVNWLLRPLEPVLVSTTPKSRPMPLYFIIGPPRCGSTLLYQVLVDCLDAAYLSNLHAWFYGMPALVERLVPVRATVGPTTRVAHESALGLTQGWASPSEAGRFWYRFFPRDVQTVCRLSDKKREQLQRATRRFSETAGRPVIFKNLFSTLRLSELAMLFPEASFIVVHRNEIDTGHSLLEARHTRYGGYESWYSVPVPEMTKLQERPPHEQVIEQIRSLYRLIEEQAAEIGESRFLHLDYERLCEDPESVLTRVTHFSRRHGPEFVRRHMAPEPFVRRRQVRIDHNLYERMVQYADASS